MDRSVRRVRVRLTAPGLWGRPQDSKTKAFIGSDRIFGRDVGMHSTATDA